MKKIADLPEQAECGAFSTLLGCAAEHIEEYLQFKHNDALRGNSNWQQYLNQNVPENGVGCNQVMSDFQRYVMPNGSPIAKPGFTSFITTGATSMGLVANLLSSVAGTQRLGITAFNFLEELSLKWLAEMFRLPAEMKGVYSSGGSIANIIALGAARQYSFEKMDVDISETGMTQSCSIYCSVLTHRTVDRAAAVLGLGRTSIKKIAGDANGRMLPHVLKNKIEKDIRDGRRPVAVVVNAGATGTGIIDPIAEIAEICMQFNVWLHVDGAYGLPGILDPRVSHLYKGIEKANSVSVDPHKWLGAPIGIGATFVRDRSLLHRTFAQGESDYLEGSFSTGNELHSMDGLGVPYSDFGLELSAPSRGAVVWSLLKEIGVSGMRERVCRHNAMARHLAELAEQHSELELLQPPTLSICCFRYYSAKCSDLNGLNRQIHRQLIQNNRNMPSTALVKNKLALRPCFLGARTQKQHVDDLIQETVEIGRQLMLGNANFHRSPS